MTDELLAKLEKLDPETWNCYQHRLAPLRDTPCDMRRGKIIMLSILQGVVQDATRAKGWRATVGTPDDYRDGEIEAVAKISYPTTEGERLQVLEFSQTEAEALLAAYVAALEAEATR